MSQKNAPVWSPAPWNNEGFRRALAWLDVYEYMRSYRFRYDYGSRPDYSARVHHGPLPADFKIELIPVPEGPLVDDTRRCIFQAFGLDTKSIDSTFDTIST